MSEQWRSYLQDNHQRFVEELVEFLRIPSVSTDPAYTGRVRAAAQWVVERMQRAGVQGARILETDGHPVVYGEWIRVEDKPTVLVYGHFDVQPADPLDLWDTPPFEPRIADGRVYARGASDMKANDLLPIIALEAMLSTDGALPVNVKFLFEGEEEIGSPSLQRFIAEYRELLACDIVVCADGGVGSVQHPVVNVGRRGLCALEVRVQSAGTDLHSGGAGGIVPNAIHALVSLLDSMRDADGRILVAGFYDDVRALSAADRDDIAASLFNEEAYKTNTGIKDFFGEPEFTPQERNVARPTLEVNGIWGGYQGAGVKTVIPAQAFAKITCRLVPDQSPEQVRALVIDHIRKHTPSQVEVTVETLPGEADPYVLSQDIPALVALEKAVGAVSERTPTRVRGGGTVPVTGIFKRELGVETITLGASEADERAHAPNEFVRLSNYQRIQSAYCVLFQELGS